MSAEAKSITDVERVAEFQYIPKMMVLGSYGGGDAMQTARQIISLKCEVPKDLPDALQNDMLAAMVFQCIEDHNAIPRAKRVAKLPETAPENLAEFARNAHFQISSHVYGEMMLNVMYQVSLCSIRLSF
jgi:hypothetical protein